MKRVPLLLAAAMLGLSIQAEPFTVDTSHAGIGFSVKHLMISDVNGTFKKFQGSVDYDLAEKKLVSIEGWIDVASIDTSNEGRDNHLKNADYFNTEKFPKILFKSTSVEMVEENSFKVTGMLNILGKDHEMVLPVTVAGPIDDQRGGKRIGLSCEMKLNRRELGITTSPAAMIGDQVSIKISAEAVHKPEA
jgi:polyisoprenoid-binding protein YceI